MSRLLALCLLIALPAAAEGQEARRFAVIVGANAGALGRPSLQYAHDDARAMADVLRTVGHFAPDDVRLLFDPRPEELLSTLDVALGLAAAEPRGAMVLFYYSGHADELSLYPSGRRLMLSALKNRLDGASATVRVGILDACRGGGWTGAKGLTPTASFEVAQPMLIESEGSVLIASSSGLENANEAQVLGGSIFTHHLLAALRGAADLSGEGEVSASEAFAYARELTVRDSAILTSTPQHPSFQVNLKGREDLPLTRVARSASVVAVRQQDGPLQLLEVASGRHVVEIPAGKRTATVALAPGRYLALKQERGRRFARAFELGPAMRFELDEATLMPAENLAVATKGLHAHPWNTITLEPVALIGSVVVLGYERVMAPYWSLRGDFTYRLPIRGSEYTYPFGLDLELGGRYYFYGRAPEGLFTSSALGLSYAGVDGGGGPLTHGDLILDFGHTWLAWNRFAFTLAVGTKASLAMSTRAFTPRGRASSSCRGSGSRSARRSRATPGRRRSVRRFPGPGVCEEAPGVAGRALPSQRYGDAVRPPSPGRSGTKWAPTTIVGRTSLPSDS